MKRWVVMMVAAVGALTLAGHAAAQQVEGTIPLPRYSPLRPPSFPGRGRRPPSDRIILVGLLVQANAADKFALADQQFSFEPYALMVRRNDSAFRLVANRTLARLYRSGDIGPIFGRWFGMLGKPSPGLVVMFGVMSTPE